MSSDARSHPNYMAIFAWLGVLTAAEIGVTFLHAIPHLMMATMLIAMALAKAVLVAAYFMHLRFEKRTLAMIAVVPLILCTFLLLMLVPDIHWVWRPH